MPQISNSIALAAAVAVLLGCVAWLLLREAGRRRQALESLRRMKDQLESQADERANERRDLSARLQSIIDSAVDGIIVIDAQGRIVSFNRGAERLFGYPGAEVIGRNVNMPMPSPDREQHDGYIARYLTTGEAKIIGIGREVTGFRRDGTTFPVHLSVGEMTVHGERKFTGILHDLSARVRIEERLREQSTLARLGEMAAVIAHEVKNPLAGIRGAIEVDGSAPPIEADPELLKIVFQNLLMNSAHAMQGQGTIRISIGTVDGSCQIAFIDRGPGIAPDILEKIFTPFFTTKSRGSGLGLPTARRLIEAHHGSISVECPPVGGTTVSIRLPAGLTTPTSE